jgi:hypothetical protein
MYFSMQFVKVVCSEEEMEEPGLGIARSKQCSLTFCDRKCQKIMCAWETSLWVEVMGGREGCIGGVVTCTYVDEESGVLQSGLLADLLHDFGLCVEGHFELLLYGRFSWWGFDFLVGQV